MPDLTPSPIRALAPDAELKRLPQGDLSVVRGRRQLPVPSPGPGLTRMLETLAAGGATREQLEQQVRSLGEPQDLLRLALLLEDLDSCRLLSWQAPADDPNQATALLSVVPYRNAIEPPRQGPAPAATAWQLSRFAYLRRHRGEIVVESPLAGSYVEPRGDLGVELLSSWFRDALDETELCRRIAGLSATGAKMIIDLLWQHGFLCSVDGEGNSSEEQDSTLQQWQFHDLLFHARSRHGRHDQPYGGTYPFTEQVEPLPAVPKPRGEPLPNHQDLYRPDLERLSHDDPPFTQILERRRSWRTPKDQALTARQLGELLYRSCRIKELTAASGHQTSRRVYPGGGALYELEIYPLVHRCDGLDDGLYHYDALNHRLETMTGDPEALSVLLETAAQSAGNAPPPDVLILVSARFQRITWKYRSMAYAGILKNVGVLYQTLYLAASAMNLGICALGGGNSDLFARATGLSYTVETSVGELLLNGSLDDSASSPPTQSAEE